MSIDVIVEKRVEKDVKKVPKYIQERFLAVLDSLTTNPLLGIPLSGRLEGKRKIRIGEYRIVYKFFVEENLIIIYKVESRQGVYKN